MSTRWSGRESEYACLFAPAVYGQCGPGFRLSERERIGECDKEEGEEKMEGNETGKAVALNAHTWID